MSIESTITETIAEVEVSDEYRVNLRTRRKLTDLSPDEAVQLANELTQAATEAETVMRADVEAAAEERRQRAVAHGFDIDWRTP